jgi:membrane-associated phospholipid phosphatase
VKLLAIAASCAVLSAICILAIDEPLARWVDGHVMHDAAWNRGLDPIEIAIGIEPWRWLGVAVLVTTSIAALLWYRPIAPALLVITSTHLLATNLMMWGKLVAGRLRPIEWIAAGGGPTFWQHGQSFPSGHVTLVGSLVVPIVVVWPRRAWPLLAVVAYAMLARIAVNAHFVSDTFAALALVAATTWLCAAVIRAIPSQR